jgi:hypothetical protein
MAYDSVLYHKEAAEKDPDLLSTSLTLKQRRARGQQAAAPPAPTRFTTDCPLCGAVDEDTRHHIYHSCPSTAHERQHLREALAATTRKYYHTADLAAQQVADVVMARGDYYAGQISAQAMHIIAADAAASSASQATGSGPTNIGGVKALGRLQATVLAHSITIHKKRAAAAQGGRAPRVPQGHVGSTTHRPQERV